MDFNVRWIDVTDALRSRQQPHFLLERPRVGGNRPAGSSVYGNAAIARCGEFWVPVNAINAGEIDWAMTHDGGLVRVPVWPYAVAERSKSVLAACGMEMGFRAGHDLARRHAKPVEEVTIVLGSTIDEHRNGYRYYLGIAIRVQD